MKNGEGHRPARIRIFHFHSATVAAEGIRSLLAAPLGFSVVGEAQDAQTGLPMVKDLKPDVVLCGIRPGHFSPVQIMEELAAVDARVPVLVLTNIQDRTAVLDALRAHVAGYLLASETSGRQLVHAIHSVAAGMTVLGPTIERIASSALAEASSLAPVPVDGLTQREQRILDLMVRGSGSREIALRLGVSVRTIQTHTRSLFAKLGVHSRLEAVTRVLRDGDSFGLSPA